MKKSSVTDKGKRSEVHVEKVFASSSMEPATTSDQIPATIGMRASCSSFTFTELLAHEGNSCPGSDKVEEESDGEKSRTLVSISMKNSNKRGSSQLPNLDLSLLPSRESFELFRTPQRSAPQPNQWSPFSGFRSPYFGGVSPLNINASSNQQQQQSTQLTIFYGGTVNVYNVSADMAKSIMVLASSGVNNKANSTPSEIMSPTPLPTGRLPQIQPSFTLKSANLPISRKNSLQRFLEKRNDRLHARAPYANANNAPLRQN